jgi:hypothetical protein
VTLTADAGEYIVSVKEAKNVTGDLDNKVQATDRDLKKLPKDAAAAAAAMKLLSDDVKKGTTSLDQINGKLAETEKALKAAAEEFNRTGNAASLQNMFKLGTQKADLLKLRKQITDALGPAEPAGRSWFQKFFDGAKSETKAFTKEFEGGWLKALFTTPTGLAAVAGGAVLLGNMIGGAVLTGIGLAGIGGGIAIALHDPKAQAALAQFKTDVGAGLKDAAQPFVAEVSQGIGILDQGFQKSLPGIQGMFAELAPEVTTLAHGISNFLGPVVTGFEHAAIAAKPLVDQFANSFLPQLGKNLGSLFDTMAANSKEAEGGMRALESTINDTVIITRDLIPVMAKLGDVLKYGTAGGLTDFGIKLFYGKQALDAYHNMGPYATQVTEDLVAAFHKAAPAADTYADAIRHLNDMFTQTINLELQVSGDQDAVTRGLLSMKDAIDQNGKSLQDNTLNGLDNRDMLRQLVQAAEKQREDAIAAAGGQNANAAAINAANQKYQEQIQAIETHAAKVGYDKSQVDAFIQSIDGIPAQKTVHIKVLSSGSDIGGLHSGPIAQRWGGITHAATGLLSAGVYSPMSPARYAFAEPQTGGEGFVPKYGDYNRSTAIIDQEARWYGGRFMPGGMGGAGTAPAVNVYVSAKDGASQAILNMIDVRIEQADQRTALTVAGGPRV